MWSLETCQKQTSGGKSFEIVFRWAKNQSGFMSNASVTISSSLIHNVRTFFYLALGDVEKESGVRLRGKYLHSACIFSLCHCPDFRRSVLERVIPYKDFYVQTHIMAPENWTEK